MICLHTKSNISGRFLLFSLHAFYTPIIVWKKVKLWYILDKHNPENAIISLWMIRNYLPSVADRVTHWCKLWTHTARTLAWCLLYRSTDDEVREKESLSQGLNYQQERPSLTHRKLNTNTWVFSSWMTSLKGWWKNWLHRHMKRLRLLRLNAFNLITVVNVTAEYLW